MYEPLIAEKNFEDCPVLESCFDTSKEAVLERIEGIMSVHAIRNALAKQCFVGLVGLQNAGRDKLRIMY